MADTVSPIVNGAAVVSSAGLGLLDESHAVASRAFLLSQSGARTPLPLISGSVSADSGDIIRRSASLTVLGSWSDDAHSQLTPYGSRVAIERGIRLAPDAVEWVPLMVGRITEVGQSSDDRDAAMKLTIKDDASALKSDRFDVATSTVTTEGVVAAMTRLVSATLPTVTVVDLTGSTATCGAMDLQQDRAGAVDKLATSIGVEAFFGRDGSFIIRPQPTLDDAPRWRLSVGESGNLISVERSRKADGIYNRVFASGETNTASSSTSTPPPTGEAKITDVTDPLLYGGPFGKVTRFYKSPLLKTADQCTTAAASLLEKARGTSYEISFTSLVNPGVDPGDVVESIISDGVRRVHIIDSVTIPLSPADSQSVTVRSLELPAETSSTA